MTCRKKTITTRKLMVFLDGMKNRNPALELLTEAAQIGYKVAVDSIVDWLNDGAPGGKNK